MTQTYKVQVSMNQAHIVESGFVWKQGDFGFNIEIEVMDFDTTGATPQIIFRKSTGAVEATQISVAGNKFTYAIRGTELDTPGPCVCDLKLKDSTTKRVSTASFKYFVIPDTMDGLEQEASSYSDTIEQIVGGFDGKIQEIKSSINTKDNNDLLHMSRTENLFDKNQIYKGYYDNNGEIAANTNYGISNKIIVPNGKKVVLSYARTTGGKQIADINGCRFLTIYNKDGSLYGNNNNVRFWWNNDTGEDKYVVFTIYLTNDQITDIMVTLCAGSVNAPKYTDIYSPYISEYSTNDYVIKAKSNNLYNPNRVLVGYVDNAGSIDSNSRYMITEKIEVPSGKCLMVSYEDQGARYSSANSARFITIYNADDTLVGDAGARYYWNNNTENTKYAVVTLFYSSPRSNIMIEFGDYNSGAPVAKSVVNNLYESYEEEIIFNYDTEKEYPQYFKKELHDVALRINRHTDDTCLVLNIITDTHMGISGRQFENAYETIENVKKLNDMVYIDGVVHLGDLVDQNISNTLSDDEIYQIMQDYINTLKNTNRNTYIVNGNHDGDEANLFRADKWYGIAGRLNYSNSKSNDDKLYFWTEDKKTKTRLVFIAIPDDVTGQPYFGYTYEILKWLRDSAFNIEDNWKIIMFAHIPPFFAYFGGEILNKTSFYGLCNAFNQKGTYSDAWISCDFTGQSGSKIIAYITGHGHGDAILEAGETVTGTDYQGHTVTTTNEMPCPVISIGCNLLSMGSMTNYNAVAPYRQDQTKAQDLWDTLIYRPDEGVIYMIRFGAGTDRWVSVG